MSETSGNSAYQGSILDGQMPGEDAQLFQVTDEKADSGNNSNQQPEATTQEEYEKARDEARFGDDDAQRRYDYGSFAFFLSNSG